MSTEGSLRPEERDFLYGATELVLINPFTTDWLKITHRILPDAKLPLHSRKVFFATLASTLENRLQKLESRGLKKVPDFTQADQSLMRYVYLLRAFLNCNDAFEQLIKSQMNINKSINVPFAEAITNYLQDKGFSKEESHKYLALFYQIQRAYYYITSLLVGGSDSMQQLRRSIWNSIFTLDVRTYDQYLWNRMEDFSTLLLGKTGTGKGLAAAAIGSSGYIPFNAHRQRFEYSPNESFTAANLSQFPESLIESELFGHCKGAFTGAVDSHQGLLESCPPFGSLFLDEIGDVSVTVQIKLLQVLQERTFMPVGSHQLLHFRGRVIAATNRTLTVLKQEEQFRDDFFYRLCSDVIHIPSLRQRIQEAPSELEQLVRLLIKRMTGHASGNLAQRVMEILERDLHPCYPWPGNVRELEQAVRCIILSGCYDGNLDITSGDPAAELSLDIQTGKLDIRELNRRYCNMLYQRFPSLAAVARITKLDRRTVKKYLSASS